MSDIAGWLRASIRSDAINGDSFERVFCENQMRVAANRLDVAAREVKRLQEALQTIADGYDGTGARVQGTGYPDAVQQFARKAVEASDE